MRLFLVDSSIYVFRAWFGPEPERVNLAGEPNQALIGFTDFVYRLLAEQAPSHVVFAFDESLGQSERKRLYPEYKANRAPAPDELKRQFAWCSDWVEALGISRVSSPTWEADDLIGSLARYHRRPDLPVAFLTADKDLAQLVVEGDLWWSFHDDRRLGYREIRKKFGVPPEQIAAQLALTGDKIDNIPGVPEVGPKTAARLLTKFGDLETLRGRLDEVGDMKFRYAARVMQSLIEHADRIELWQQLTRINCDLADMRAVEIRRRAPDADALERIMIEQDFDRARRQRWQQLLRRQAA